MRTFKKFPKVLVLSHNAFSESSNMGKTLSSFFSGWDTDRIAQIYILKDVPDFSICNKYFYIDEALVSKSLLSKKDVGTIVYRENKEMEEPSSSNKRSLISELIYQSNIKYLPIMQLIRNLMWNTGKWRSSKLFAWIEKFNPDILFYASGNFDFSMNMAIEISEIYDIPLLVYFGDEFFFYNGAKWSLFNLINRTRYKNTFVRLFDRLETYVTASDSMNNLYRDFFGEKGYSMMASTKIEAQEKTNNPVNITYAGGLTLGRWKSLIDIGSSLHELGHKLDIYSGENNPKLISKLKASKGIKFNGFVNSDQLRNIYTSSTILVHVEDTSEDNTKRTMYSMSTKIPSMLGSGVCIFAYGPTEVASLKYLLDNEAGYVVSKKIELTKALKELLQKESLRNEYVEKAKELALKRHNYEENQKKFYDIIMESIATYESR